MRTLRYFGDSYFYPYILEAECKEYDPNFQLALEKYPKKAHDKRLRVCCDYHWTAHLAKLLNIPSENVNGVGTPGSGNPTILGHILKNLNSFNSDDVIITTVTTGERIELPRSTASSARVINQGDMVQGVPMGPVLNLPVMHEPMFSDDQKDAIQKYVIEVTSKYENLYRAQYRRRIRELSSFIQDQVGCRVIIVDQSVWVWFEPITVTEAAQKARRRDDHWTLFGNYQFANALHQFIRETNHSFFDIIRLRRLIEDGTIQVEGVDYDSYVNLEGDILKPSRGIWL